MKMFWLVLMLTASTSVFAGGESHGGDPSPRARLKEAKEQGALILLQLEPSELDPSIAPKTRAWIEKNRIEWATDVASSPHIWPETEEDDKNLIAGRPEHLKLRSATTKAESKANIEFSTSIVEKKAPDVERALQVVWHESCHHLGEVDEVFIDSLVSAVYLHWRLKRFGGHVQAEKGYPIAAPQGMFDPNALKVCESLVFDSDKTECLAQIKFGKFDPDAVQQCAIVPYAADRILCLNIIRDAVFDKAALLTCSKYKAVHPRLECFRTIAVKPAGPPPEPKVFFSGWGWTSSGIKYGGAALTVVKQVIRNQSFNVCERNNKTTQYYDPNWEVNNCWVQDNWVTENTLDLNSFLNHRGINLNPRVVRQRSAECNKVYYRCTWVQYVSKGR